MLGCLTGMKYPSLFKNFILITFCFVLSGALYAQTDEEPKTKPAVTTSTESAETETAPVEEVVLTEAEIELAAILKKNKKCLRCHTKDKVKMLEDGEEMSLTVHRDDYTGSAHAEVACIGCHVAIGNRKHPSKKTNISITSQRDYSIELNQGCRECHEENYTQYEHSIHASMIKQGSEKAPLCTDCHSAHAVETMDVYQPETGFPCKKCHESVYDSYTASVHGEARLEGNVIRDTHIQSPICSDCHQSHDVNAMAIGDTIRTTCISCHENIELVHTQWLPNAGTHLDIVSCAVCHAPFAKRRFDLHLYDNVAKVPVSQPEGADSIQKQMEEMQKVGGNVFDTLAAWRAAHEVDGKQADVSIRGRMEVRSGVAAHQIAGKSFAVRTCDSCHKDDPRQNENVTLTVTTADGRRETVEANSDVLAGVATTNSIRDFYAPSGTLDKMLDIMLLLSLAAGIAVPVGHFTLGKMIKEKMQRGEK